MIRIDNVTKRFQRLALRADARAVTALADVSLEIPAGELWGVVGPNGAGKTTLFGVLLGFLFPTDGDVEIAGLEPRAYVRRHGASYLPERFRAPDSWTVRGSLRALARLEKLGRDADRRADEAIERFDLAAHASKRVGALSRGLLQRLGLAQALLARRDLVVLDEPGDGLDPLWRIRFRELLDELKRDGRTVLLASHDLPEVERHADAVALLDGGRVRDVLRMRAPAGAPRTYRIDLAAATPAFDESFPAARRLESELSYAVDVGDEVELSARLAALLEAGGIVASVAPMTGTLEERLRDARGDAS